MLQKVRKALIAAAAIITCMVLPLSANAYGPSSLNYSSTSCTTAYCVMYPKTVELPNGNLLATYEDGTTTTGNLTFPIYRSSDQGQTWTKITTVSDTHRNWGNATNPMLYVLPQAIGNMPAGTILLAGIASPSNHTSTAVELYKSNDNGSTWSWVSEIAVGGSYTTTPVWEPFLMVANNKLICYYSDERDKANFNQKTVHQTSVNGVNWGPVVNDNAYNASLRPGMPVVTKMANGQYIMTYEIANTSGTPTHFKISSDPESWTPSDQGSPIGAGNGSPFIITLPDGKLAYNSYGSSDIYINSNNGVGAWTPVHSNIPNGYSRMLQYVSATGRVLVMSSDGFWATTKNTVTYGDVDLGNSVGTYYKLVNRKSGKALGVNAASLQDGTSIVQWTDNGSADQQWHVTDLGNGYKTLLNKNSGRAIGIYQGSNTNGANAVQWVQNNSNDQQFQLVAVGSYYKLVDRNSGLVLGVNAGSTQDGAQIVQWTDNGSLDQQWQLVQIP